MTTHAMASTPALAAGGGRHDNWSLVEWIRTTLIKLESSAIWYRRYRATAQELSALSNRELDDIGIARCDIPTISTPSSPGILP